MKYLAFLLLSGCTVSMFNDGSDTRTSVERELDVGHVEVEPTIEVTE